MLDSEIVELFWQRNQNAITAANQKYDGLIKQVANNILHNKEDAAECANDVYLAAWNTMPDMRPQNLAAYLLKLARTSAIDIYRRNHAQKRMPTQYTAAYDELCDVISDKNTTEQALNKRMLDDVINRFINNLPSTDGDIFICRYFFFDSIKDIAHYTGLTQSNIKQKLYRMRYTLKEILIKEGFDV